MDSISSGDFDLPSYPFAPNPLLSVNINSPFSFRPNITAGDPSHLIVVSLGLLSKLCNDAIAFWAPALPSQII